MKAIQTAAQAATALLSIETNYATLVVYYSERGTLKDDADMTSEEKAAKKECKEAIYQALSKREGGIAAKAAKLTGDAWKELTGHEKDEYQAERSRVKGLVDNRWKRLRIAAGQYKEEAAAKEAAESGQPQPAKAKKTLLERFTDFEVAATKGNKKSPEIDPAILADLLAKVRGAIVELLEEAKV